MKNSRSTKFNKAYKSEATIIGMSNQELVAPRTLVFDVMKDMTTSGNIIHGKNNKWAIENNSYTLHSLYRQKIELNKNFSEEEKTFILEVIKILRRAKTRQGFIFVPQDYVNLFTKGLYAQIAFIEKLRNQMIHGEEKNTDMIRIIYGLRLIQDIYLDIKENMSRTLGEYLIRPDSFFKYLHRIRYVDICMSMVHLFYIGGRYYDAEGEIDSAETEQMSHYVLRTYDAYFKNSNEIHPRQLRDNIFVY